MTSSDLAILVLVVVIAWFAWRLLRRKHPTLTPSVPANMAGSAPRPPIAQNAEQALALLASCAHPQGFGDLTTIVQARIADQGPVDWHFNFTAGTCALVRGPADGASLTISATSQVWRDLAAKRIGFASALMKGSLHSEGDTGVLMQLDGAFAGPPDESLLVGSHQTQPSPEEESQIAMSNPAVAEALHPLMRDNQALLDVLRAAQKNPNLSAAERQAEIVEAIRHNLGPGAEALTNREDGSVENTFRSVPASTDSKSTARDVRRAIQEAVRNLPPGATREQKMAAIKAAIGTMPNAGPFAAMLEGNTSGSVKGIGGKAAEIMIEGLLEGLLGGG